VLQHRRSHPLLGAFQDNLACISQMHNPLRGDFSHACFFRITVADISRMCNPLRQVTGKLFALTYAVSAARSTSMA
jgi:hypothetical protein